jgi:hypothetical protein
MAALACARQVHLPLRLWVAIANPAAADDAYIVGSVPVCSALDSMGQNMSTAIQQFQGWRMGQAP